MGRYFETRTISNGSWRITRSITTNIGITPDWPASRPLKEAVRLRIRPQDLPRIAGDDTATACFRLQLRPELQFATHTILNGSSILTRPITTDTAVTPGWSDLRRLNAVANPHTQSRTLSYIAGDHTPACFIRQLPPEL
jgi:hypothetical protein